MEIYPLPNDVQVPPLPALPSPPTQCLNFAIEINADILGILTKFSSFLFMVLFSNSNFFFLFIIHMYVNKNCLIRIYIRLCEKYKFFKIQEEMKAPKIVTISIKKFARSRFLKFKKNKLIKVFTEHAHLKNF